MSWGVLPDGRTGLSPLLDPLLESSSLDPLESPFLDPLLESVQSQSYIYTDNSSVSQSILATSPLPGLMSVCLLH